ncbi:MAG: hypothetical protein A3I88_03725 [Candidatus Portnoybacteria bacterium RIFCSPLOWO2_12_FULL_39_9]|uniref:Uncharacterized protein n=1 Tax=Candidatus Portnoybacteria bacterium RIFCSPHIGHO2_12_FULL_38_9 TaxID=1801997 RepID=A0A1G2FFY4_9BACT|nr:MAG: hypothetical protein A2646_03705 [Candidatus Portnoybacteria bacterium RIFCSPHIGHO2_02_FULL_39_12]OGZ36966.1 MAG: hypothetical protein A3J64_03775 [Candidatus Portnoybacteria bacterium RIFCSPHIGHO2_12_FULL_38_9]OGZ37956.1 MAG: hypothetical protein A3F21_02085 [Candidatus Portnoybacteria bacterium RIFCSPLOWO2_01_FULL_38_39]OGZ39979.1 MAG: hypothetical protein A3I88_03725 [Candidatus Portnoybacteria bacterium RIFCSPLOWO2_12_FULL_39_9]
MKKTIVIFSILAIIGGVILGAYGYFGGNKFPDYDFITAEKKDLIQEVSVTGRVKPAQVVELAFEKGGKIAAVFAAMGDKAGEGDILVSIDNKEILAQLKQAEAGVENAKAALEQSFANLEIQKEKLAELERGARTEEIEALKTKVGNAENSLKDAQANLENVKNKAEADLNDNYNSALTTSQKSVSAAKNSLLTLSDIQSNYFTGYDEDSVRLAEAKAAAVETLLGASNAGRWKTEFISVLNGGAFGTVQDAFNNPTYENIDRVIQETIAALQKTKSALDSVSVKTALSSAEKTNLSTEQSNINAEITALFSKKEAIETQKALNSNNITLSQISLTNAQNTFKNTRDDLRIKEAGAAPEQIAGQKAQIRQAQAGISSQKAQVKQAEANVLNIQAQIAKTVIRAPFNGLITKQEAKVGEIVPANALVVSLISEKKFEIEANAPEADVAKIKINDEAKITLDAFGNEVIFKAKIVSIEPAETIIDGVAAYKTTLQFIEEDKRIKSGMTANIDILTDQRENIIAVPQRAVISKNGEQIVRLLANEKIREVKVKTGLAGSNGNIEIIEGVKEGDKVIIFLEER